MHSVGFSPAWPQFARNLLVCGSRHFTDYPALILLLDQIAGIDSIIHGGAPGADALAGRYALDRHLPVRVFPANWRAYGRAAGPLRNRQMAACADCCLAFWDGTSAGTADMVSRMRDLGRPVRIFRFTS